MTHEHDVLLGDTPTEFAELVVRVLESPELARRLGANARDLAVNRYAWPSIVGQLERFYDQLAG